jgi:hypothetical protein
VKVVERGRVIAGGRVGARPRMEQHHKKLEVCTESPRCHDTDGLEEQFPGCDDEL